MAIPILKLRNKATGKWNGVPVLIGEPAKLISQITEYQLSDSGITPPSGDWLSEPPVTAPGKYLWERITQNWNKGEPKILYLPVYQGQDGKGTVNSVAGVMPDPVTHDVSITADNIGIVDHVTDKNLKSSGWSWLKYESGAAVAWYTGEHKNVAPTWTAPWGKAPGLNGYTLHVSYPFTFAGPVSYIYSGHADTGSVIPGETYPERENADLYFSGSVGGNRTFTISIIAMGRWK